MVFIVFDHKDSCGSEVLPNLHGPWSECICFALLNNTSELYNSLYPLQIVVSGLASFADA